MQDQLLTLREVCELTKLSRTTVYKFVAAGQFPRHVKVGGKASRWRASELAEWIEQLQ
jgi:prophage regulatory protein